MTDTTEELFSNFHKLWRSGKDAHLSLECHAGKAWVHLRVLLPSPPPEPPDRRHQKRKPGPSRLRRRARRAEARVAAANAATNATAANIETVAEETTVKETCEEDSNTTAEQVVLANLPDEGPTLETTETSIKAVQLNACARPWPHSETIVADEFCPDQHYQQTFQPEAPPNQCSICGKTFGSKRALSNHTRVHHLPQS